MAEPDSPPDSEESKDVAGSSPLAELFGDHPRTRIVSALAAAANPANPSRICESAGIDESTWYRHRDSLLAVGIIEKVGNAGNSPLYALTDSELSESVQTARALAGAELRDS